jgi:hypothetical protein
MTTSKSMNFREATARHQAERAAWQRVRAARRELALALAGYECFLRGEPVNGLVELPVEVPVTEPAKKPKRDRKKREKPLDGNATAPPEPGLNGHADGLMKRSQGSFKDGAVKTETEDFVPEPFGEPWDEASIKNAIEDLGLGVESQAIFCADCRSMRARWVGKCPDCSSEKTQEINPRIPAIATGAQPARRGPGRPPGSKTKSKAVAL